MELVQILRRIERQGGSIRHIRESPKKTVIDGTPAIRLDLELIFPAGWQARHVEYIMIKDGMVCTVSLDIGDDDFERFEQYLSTFEQSALSLEFSGDSGDTIPISR